MSTVCRISLITVKEFLHQCQLVVGSMPIMGKTWSTQLKNDPISEPQWSQIPHVYMWKQVYKVLISYCCWKSVNYNCLLERLQIFFTRLLFSFKKFQGLFKAYPVSLTKDLLWPACNFFVVANPPTFNCFYTRQKRNKRRLQAFISKEKLSLAILFSLDLEKTRSTSEIFILCKP